MLCQDSSRKILSCYIIYKNLPGSDNSVVLSHIHETEAYKQAMMVDLEKLGYSRDYILKNIRDKWGAFLWELNFAVRDENNEPYQGLKIRNTRTGKILNLYQYKGETLESYSELRGILRSEDCGWELNLPFKDEKQLFALAKLFSERSYKLNKNPWPGSYDVPVIILGNKARVYKTYLSNFSSAKKIYIQKNGNEISFIINKKFPKLVNLRYYTNLHELGFIEENCLANKLFLKKYVDKKR